MTITREQLEKAAKAAGIEVFEDKFGLCTKVLAINQEYQHAVWVGDTAIQWNPMHDHGQLLDLAMACKIELMPMTNEICYAVKGAPSFRFVNVNCQDFPALAEAVILAACEQFDAKPKLAPDTAKQLLESIEYERLGGDD